MYLQVIFENSQNEYMAWQMLLGPGTWHFKSMKLEAVASKYDQSS